jgi:nicotinate-nucleotide adenylyltransferase
MGGTFDPVHLGHLAVAEEARSNLDLSEVLFLPAGHPYFKDFARISPAPERVEMLRLALEGRAFCKISLIEIERPGPSYAVDSVEQLKKGYGDGAEMFFIMGLDSFLSLPLWQDAERLLGLCRIVVAPRPGPSRIDLESLERDLPGITEGTIIMTGPLMDISSTDIRERVKQGLTIKGLVPEAVAKYINEHRLYGRGQA